MNRLAAVMLIALVATGLSHAQPRRGPGLGRRPATRPKQAFDRLNRMNPEQRRKAIEKLPPDRQKQMEQRLEDYNRLSPEVRDKLANRYESFQQLPEAQQEAMRKLYRRFNTLPPERREVMREEVRELYRLPASDRMARMNSDEYRNKFSRQEQTMLRDFADSLRRQQ